MSPQDLANLISFLTISLGVKIFLLTFIFFYAVFALVVLRQTQLMLQILDEASFSPFLKFLAAIHFMAAVGVFLSALILLTL